MYSKREYKVYRKYIFKVAPREIFMVQFTIYNFSLGIVIYYI